MYIIWRFECDFNLMRQYSFINQKEVKIMLIEIFSKYYIKKCTLIKVVFKETYLLLIYFLKNLLLISSSIKNSNIH